MQWRRLTPGMGSLLPDYATDVRSSEVKDRLFNFNEIVSVRLLLLLLLYSSLVSVFSVFYSPSSSRIGIASSFTWLHPIAIRQMPNGVCL